MSSLLLFHYAFRPSCNGYGSACGGHNIDIRPEGRCECSIIWLSLKLINRHFEIVYTAFPKPGLTTSRKKQHQGESNSNKEKNNKCYETEASRGGLSTKEGTRKQKLEKQFDPWTLKSKPARYSNTPSHSHIPAFPRSRISTFTLPLPRPPQPETDDPTFQSSKQQLKEPPRFSSLPAPHAYPP